MGKTRAQIQADYRARKKLKMGDEWKRLESERVKKYYVPVSKLTKKQVKQRREEVNYRVRKHRITAKRAEEQVMEHNQPAEDNDDADSAIMSDVSHNSVVGAGTSSPRFSPLRVKMQFKKRVATRKRTSRALSKAHRRIESLNLKLQAVQRQNKKLSKRHERAMNRIDEMKVRSTANNSVPDMVKNTPRSKVESQLRNAGLSPRSVPKVIKRQLQYSHAVLDEIRIAATENKKQRERKVLSNIVSGKVLKKYRFLNKTRKETGLGWRNLSGTKCKQASMNKKTLRQYWGIIHKEAVSFLERDDNSRMMPGKNDTCKSNDGKRQVKFLCDYLYNLYLKYKSENPDKRHVSFSAFKRIRQTLSHIKLVKFASRNTSLCQKHQNMALKLKALKSIGVVSVTSPDEFITNYDDSAITNMLESVTRETIDFEEWCRVSDEHGKKKTKLIRIVSKKADFISMMERDVVEFRQHVIRVKKQFSAIKTCKENLQAGECVVQMDFAENYVCVPMEEVQSGYWNQEGVTLHPIVVYFRDNGLQHRSFAAVSDDKGHNTSTIFAIIKELMTRLVKIVPGLSRVHYWTDSPTSQYRNKTMFAVVADHHLTFNGIYAIWNYFEAGHGKGPCDGIGGTVKRLADEAVKRGTAVIQDAHDFYAWACQERESSGIDYFFVSKSDCQASANMINDKWSTLKGVPGTLKVHAVIGNYQHNVLVRDTSCYCDKCLTNSPNLNNYDIATMCEGWKPHSLVNLRVFSKPSEVSPAPLVTSPAENDASPDDDTHGFQTDDWVAALYDNEWYIGQVLDMDEEDVYISFMTKGSKINENIYKWPSEKDEIWVPVKDVLCHIDTPMKASRGRLFTISNEQKSFIIEKHNNALMHV